MYLESKRTDSESPTEYNVNVLTLASREIKSSPVVKKAMLAAETPFDSPAKNTHRAGRKRYYEKLDHDEDSEEESKPHYHLMMKVLMVWLILFIYFKTFLQRGLDII